MKKFGFCYNGKEYGIYFQIALEEGPSLIITLFGYSFIFGVYYTPDPSLDEYPQREQIDPAVKELYKLYNQ